MSVGRVPTDAITLKDGSVLVIGGDATGSTASAEIYDPTSGTFGALIPIPSPGGQSPASLLPDGRVLLAGGTAMLFDPKLQAFAPTGGMVTPRYGATATVLPDGNVLVAGGYDASNTAVNTAEVYDSKTGTFSQVGSLLPAAGSNFSVLLPNGKVLLMGGRISQLYDPQTRSFSYGAESAVRHVFGGAFLMPNGTAMVTYGQGDTFEFYHP